MDVPPSADTPDAPVPAPPPLAPVLMMAFWALLGAAAGVKTGQGVWHLLDWGGGDVSVAVPVGGVLGAACGALLGLITRPTLLVLLMAVFAGASAGGVAGQLAWGGLGELGGQAGGGLVGAAAWATWLFLDRRRDRPLGIPTGRGSADSQPLPSPDRGA